MSRGAWVIVVLLIVFFFFGSVFFFFGSLIWVMGGGSLEKGDVAVIKVEGGIFDSTPVIEDIQDYRMNDDIRAVVLRIESPGGSISTSQEIYREIQRLREKKPVVASMGAVAASGGYYIACAAEKIFANPGTATGSIGVILERVDIQELAAWAKLKPEILKSGKMKDVASPLRDMTPEERNFLQSMLEALHKQFKETVATSRSLPMEKVDTLADGRIYTGEQAKELGLIDEIGTLQDAIYFAAQLAGVEGEPKVVTKEKEEGAFIRWLFGEEASTLVKGWGRRTWLPLYYSNTLGDI